MLDRRTACGSVQRAGGGIDDLGRLADDEHGRFALVGLLAAGGNEALP